MVNSRILELLQTPQNVSASDLEMLNAEIGKYPYLQSLRALKLLTIYKNNPENYASVLSETAAFTTDKKILYQLVNGKEIEKNTAEPEETLDVVNNFKPEDLPQIPEVEAPKQVFVNGELNRILFEGEEDFLELPAVAIDLESSRESGSIVINEPVAEEVNENASQPIVDETAGTPEMVINDNEGKTDVVLNEAQLSFHETDDFLPKVNITAPQPEKTQPKPEKSPEPNRHELEMQRLIAEVEAKMKTSKKSEISLPEEDEPASSEINFAENIPTESVESITISKNETEIKVNQSEENNWKPLSFDYEKSDSELSKAQDIDEEKERAPMNVSFFSDDLKQPEIPQKDTVIESEGAETDSKSNVPKFLNTWQSWLKIEKKPIEPETEIASNEPEEVKEKAIEKFIATEPKISRLKEETSYNVKEKGDNISHLMTETLANLYAEQRLYSKAINGFELLKQKHPEKSDYFEERIGQIKEQRQNKGQ